jgi:peptide/nickel transport system substrate-binding protein
VVNYHGGFILSKKAWEKLGDQATMNPVGTGPFAFSELPVKTFYRAQSK